MKINGSKHKQALFASKIIKAGALLSDTKILLGHWDPDLTTQENLSQIRHGNFFGKTSRARVSDILAIFKQRYLTEEETTRALVTFVRARFQTEALDRILYFHTARADPLLQRVVLDVLTPLQQQGRSSVSPSDVERPIRKWVSEGLTTAEWGDYTIRRVSQGLLSTLRDFGVLSGAVNKRISPAYLPTEAFAYITLFLKQHQPSGSKLMGLPDWKLFFLSETAVERFLFEAHQKGLLEYHAAGTVTRLSFPTDNLDSYAKFLTQRAH